LSPFLLLAPLRPSHSPLFPTRRSSDLASGHRRDRVQIDLGREWLRPAVHGEDRAPPVLGRQADGDAPGEPARPQERRIEYLRARSEEHTSEFQSPYDLVCRLLLEKKKH